MDRRHFNNSYTGKMGRDRHRNRAMADQSYTQSGGVPVPENGPFVHPMNNVATRVYHRTTPWNSGFNTYPSRSNMQAPHHLPQSFSGPYNEPSGAGNPYLAQQANSVISYPRSHDRHVFNRNPHVPQDSVTRSREDLKRKGPDTSVPYEMGSSSRSSELSRRRPSSNVYYGNSEGLYCGNGSPAEDSTRNVRRRSTLGLEDNNPMHNHVSSYSSHYQYPPNPPLNYHGEARIDNMSSCVTNQICNLDTIPHVVHGRFQTAGASGFSHGNNQLVVRRSAPEIRDYQSDSLSSRDVVSFPQNVHAPSQAARGQRSSHAVRDTPPYNTGPSYYPMRHERTSTDESLNPHFLSSYRQSIQYSRGWGNSYRSGTSGIAVQRFHSTAGIVNAHDRMELEGMVMDLPTFYASSRNLFDQYQDMRLDIDDMSYEELLELGESIGNVNTGLCADVIPLSLTEDAYSLGESSIEETCAICLEEYGNDVKIGTVKNCGHNYHSECIKKWLSMKNVCPICKAPALKDCSNGK